MKNKKVSIDDLLVLAGGMSVAVGELILGFQHGPKGRGLNPKKVGEAIHKILDAKFKYDRSVEQYNLQQSRKR